MRRSTRIRYFKLVRNAGQLVIGLGSVKVVQMFVSNEVRGITSSMSCIASFIVEALARSELLVYMDKFRNFSECIAFEICISMCNFLLFTFQSWNVI